ncbi:hypothetical protein ES703_43964 [subsurface metagenome]
MNLPGGIEDVKRIAFFYELWRHRCCEFLQNDHELYPLPYRVFQILPPHLLYWKGEDHPDDAILSPWRYYYILGPDNRILLPFKEFEPITCMAGRLLTVTSIILQSPPNPRDYGAEYIPEMIRFDRKAEPEDVDPISFQRWREGLANQERQASKPDPHDQVEPATQTPARLLHVVPAAPEVAKAPEPEKPTPTVGRRSVGQIRKFAYLPPRIWDLMEADSLYMAARQVYTILYTYREYPEKTRIRAKGKGPAYPLPYTITYQSQIIDNLKVRRSDLLATASSERRNQARKMGTSLSTVKRAIRRLCEAGWIARVYPGRPKDCPWLTPEQQERRIQRHEQVPQWGPQKYILATDKYQRDGIKGLNRKLKELGLPPYLIYLPGPRF